MVKFKEVKEVTTEEYFNNNQFSIDAFNKKYRINENETYTQALKRVCDFVASVESSSELKEYWSDRWFDEIYNDWWQPAGSIMQGAGSGRKISLANCTTISGGTLENEKEWDNLESIFKNEAYTIAKTAAYRQGLGFDGSRLRPKGSKLLNSANESTGVIHWLKFLDSIGYYVGQEGRIPAMLMSLDVKHPDIEDFIKVKSDYTQIQNANISVQITNDFYNAVEKDEEWIMEFKIPEVKKGDKIYLDIHSIDMNCSEDEKGKYKIATHDKNEEIIIKKIKARKLLKMIAENMFRNAEPGIQNIDIAREYSNSDAVYDSNDKYDSRIISTNACSEQYLSRESLCVLASINLEKFSTEPEQYDGELLVIGESINRFLDNVNECELRYKTYATPHQKLAIKELRRTGAGVTNIGGWLFKLNLEYGTQEANDKLYEIMDKYNYYLYQSTIKLGEEKGNFGLFHPEKIKKSKFIQELLERHPDLEFNYMRNVTVSSIAPTGTLSLMFRNMVMSYGIEPAFDLCYWKRTRMSGQYEYYFVVPGVVRKVFEDAGYKIPVNGDTVKDTWDGKIGNKALDFINEHKDKVGLKFKKATEINPFDKLDLMSKVMKSVDSSISVTYLLPENTDTNEVYKFILKAKDKGVKSIAAFPDKKMYGIISFVDFKSLATDLIQEGVTIHPQNFSEDELKELHLSNNFISYSTAPKRPKIIPADVYNIKVKGDKFIIAIGLLNGAPYEIFCGATNGLSFKFTHKDGLLTKVKRGVYKLEIGDDVEIADFSHQFSPVEQLLFRMVSTSLRHGVPLKFIVEQLGKATDDITSMSAAAARVLKKYIADGETVTGKTCPVCNQSDTLIYGKGCVECTNCNWTKCD